MPTPREQWGTRYQIQLEVRRDTINARMEASEGGSDARQLGAASVFGSDVPLEEALELVFLQLRRHIALDQKTDPVKAFLPTPPAPLPRPLSDHVLDRALDPGHPENCEICAEADRIIEAARTEDLAPGLHSP